MRLVVMVVVLLRLRVGPDAWEAGMGHSMEPRVSKAHPQAHAHSESVREHRNRGGAGTHCAVEGSPAAVGPLACRGGEEEEEASEEVVGGLPRLQGSSKHERREHQTRITCHRLGAMEGRVERGPACTRSVAKRLQRPARSGADAPQSHCLSGPSSRLSSLPEPSAA